MCVYTHGHVSPSVRIGQSVLNQKVGTICMSSTEFDSYEKLSSILTLTSITREGEFIDKGFLS